MISYCKSTLVRDVKEARARNAGKALDAPRMKAMLAIYAGWNGHGSQSTQVRSDSPDNNLDMLVAPAR